MRWLTINRARSSLDALRPQYKTTIEALGTALPPPITREATQLLMQLCDPVPAKRFPAPTAGLAGTAALNWLIRRTDILSQKSVNFDCTYPAPAERKGNMSTLFGSSDVPEVVSTMISDNVSRPASDMSAEAHIEITQRNSAVTELERPLAELILSNDGRSRRRAQASREESRVHCCSRPVCSSGVSGWS